MAVALAAGESTWWAGQCGARVHQDAVLPEQRQIRENRHEERTRNRHTRAAQTNESTRMQRPTDGQVATDRHHYSQPGAAQEEYVQQGLLVHFEVQHKHHVETRVLRLLGNEDIDKREHTEHCVGHGQCDQTEVCGLLKTVHRALQLFSRQHEQVYYVTHNSKGAGDRQRDIVDRVFQAEIGLNLS